MVGGRRSSRGATKGAGRNANEAQEKKNHRLLKDINQGTTISFYEHGGKVTAVVKTVEETDIISAVGEELMIIRLSSQRGSTLAQDYIYSNDVFEVLMLGKTAKQKLKQKKSDMDDNQKLAPHIECGDRIVSDELGSGNVILVVVKVQKTSKLANVGLWKGKPVLKLTVRAETPNADIPDGSIVSTDSKDLRWIESGDENDPITTLDESKEKGLANQKTLSTNENKHKDTVEVVEQSALDGYPSDMQIARLSMGANEDWFPGIGPLNPSGSNLDVLGARVEHLNDSTKIAPTYFTPTLKGKHEGKPTEKSHNHDRDRREYLLLQKKNTSASYTGGNTALFTLNGAAKGRFGNRTYNEAVVGQFKKLNNGNFLFIRAIVKPVSNPTFKQSYGDGHIILFGTEINCHEEPTVPGVSNVQNAGFTMRSVTNSPHSISDVAKSTQENGCEASEIAIRRLIQGDSRGLFLKEAADGEAFKPERLVDLDKNGKQAKLHCMNANSHKRKATSAPPKKITTAPARKKRTFHRPMRHERPTIHPEEKSSQQAAPLKKDPSNQSSERYVKIPGSHEKLILDAAHANAESDLLRCQLTEVKATMEANAVRASANEQKATEVNAIAALMQTVQKSAADMIHQTIKLVLPQSNPTHSVRCSDVNSREIIEKQASLLELWKTVHNTEDLNLKRQLMSLANQGDQELKKLKGE